MMAPVVITLGCPGFQSAASEAGVLLKRQTRLPAAAWTGISAAIEGSESIAGSGVVVVVVVALWYARWTLTGKGVTVAGLTELDAAGTNRRGR
jgi:hypothetical protein